MNNLANFYKTHNLFSKNFEGFSQQIPGQVEFLKNITNDFRIKNVMEIGFNAGHSAELFLSSNPSVNLVSFDIGIHKYVELGKKFINETYPDRHTLIIGNSLNTVPEYFKKENKKFDLIFIDGDHTYETAIQDLLNCKNLAHDKTIVIMDDTMNNKKWIRDWNIGPNRAWKEVTENNIVTEVDTSDFQVGRGQSWGYYNF